MAEGSGETSPLASVIGFSILPLQQFRGALAERSGRQMLVTIRYAPGMVLFLRSVSTDGLTSLLLPFSGSSSQSPPASSVKRPAKLPPDRRPMLTP